MTAGGAVLLPRPMADVLGASGVAGLVATYGATLGSTDRRAVLSLWSQHYLLLLVPSVIATALRAGPRPDVAWATAGVVLDAGGAPVAIRLPEPVPGAGLDPQDPAHRLTPLLRRHLVPLAQSLGTAGLPEAVSWSNAAHVVLWALRTAPAPVERVAGLSALLRGRDWVDGQENPLHRTMQAGARSVCCLRHRLPGVARCGDCPCSRRGGPAVRT